MPVASDEGDELPMRGQPWWSVKDDFWAGRKNEMSFCLVLAVACVVRDSMLRQLERADPQLKVDRSWDGAISNIMAAM